MIGILRWAVEIGRVDILYEVAIMSTYTAMPRMGHLEQVLHIFGYLKSHKKFRLMFDCSNPQISPNRFKTYDWEEFYRGAKEEIPSDAPKSRGRLVDIFMFVDASHASDVKQRKSQTGILIFINKAPIHWYSKRQPNMEVTPSAQNSVQCGLGLKWLKP